MASLTMQRCVVALLALCVLQTATAFAVNNVQTRASNQALMAEVSGEGEERRGGEELIQMLQEMEEGSLSSHTVPSAAIKVPYATPEDLLANNGGAGPTTAGGMNELLTWLDCGLPQAGACTRPRISST